MNFDLLEKIPGSMGTVISDPAEQRFDPDSTAPQQPRPENSDKDDIGAITDHTRVPFNQSAIPGTAQMPGTTTLNMGVLIKPEVAAQMLDIVFPTIIVYVLKMVLKKTIDKSRLQATKDEQKMIAPVLEAYLKSINFNMQNPLNALMLVMSAVYGTKTIEILNEKHVKPLQPVQQMQRREAIHTGNKNTRNRPGKKGGRPSVGNTPYMRKKYGDTAPLNTID